MYKPQHSGMKQLSAHFHSGNITALPSRAIEFVPYKRMVYVSHVYSYLMCSACLKLCPDQSVSAKTLCYCDMCYCVAGSAAVYRAPHTVAVITSDRHIYRDL